MSRGVHLTGDSGNGEPKDCYIPECFVFFTFQLHRFSLRADRPCETSTLNPSGKPPPCTSVWEAWEPGSLAEVWQSSLLIYFPHQVGCREKLSKGAWAGWGRMWIEADSVPLSFGGNRFWPCPQVGACTLLGTWTPLAQLLHPLPFKSGNNSGKTKSQPFYLKRLRQSYF